MNSWDNYYKEFGPIQDGCSSFNVCIKRSKDNQQLLEDLGYRYAYPEDAKNFLDLKVGKYIENIYEEFDEKNSEVISTELSWEIYHKHLDNPEFGAYWTPDKVFIEKWFGIDQQYILGIQSGFNMNEDRLSPEDEAKEEKRLQDLLNKFKEQQN